MLEGAAQQPGAQRRGQTALIAAAERAQRCVQLLCVGAIWRPRGIVESFRFGALTRGVIDGQAVAPFLRGNLGR